MHELLTTAQMAEADRLTIAGGTAGKKAGLTLMERAGAAVAERAAASAGAGEVVVVCGPGNNGGDGFVAARLLAGQGRRVRVLLLGEPGAIRGDAAAALRAWRGPVEPAEPSRLTGAAVIVDALFGAGLSRPIEGAAAGLIAAINDANAGVVAVDVPSGIDGTTGATMGTAVEADETVTFFRRKPGHLLLPGRRHCGAVFVADIGIDRAVLGAIRPQSFHNTPRLWRYAFPVPRRDGHKYDRGHAVIGSGSADSTGASRLAARAALRIGAGLVTLAVPPNALMIQAIANTAVMVRSVDGAAALAEFLQDRRRNAVLLGPGGGIGDAMREQVAAALASEAAVVLDADALTSFAGQADELTRAIRLRTAATVLTPHVGEFERLFKKIHEISKLKSKYERTVTAASYTGATVLLKGPDTIVASPDGRTSISDNAPPTLATAGSGDVLAGMITGLLAQGMPAFEAASSAVWLHGDVATAFGPGLIAEDLSEGLPAALQYLMAGETGI